MQKVDIRKIYRLANGPQMGPPRPPHLPNPQAALPATPGPGVPTNVPPPTQGNKAANWQSPTGQGFPPRAGQSPSGHGIPNPAPPRTAIPVNLPNAQYRPAVHKTKLDKFLQKLNIFNKRAKMTAEAAKTAFKDITNIDKLRKAEDTASKVISQGYNKVVKGPFNIADSFVRSGGDVADNKLTSRGIGYNNYFPSNRRQTAYITNKRRRYLGNIEQKGITSPSPSQQSSKKRKQKTPQQNTGLIHNWKQLLAGK